MKKDVFLSWNITSLLRSERVVQENGKYLKPVANRVFMIEPEFQLNKRWSLKIPLGVGLEFIKTGYQNDFAIHYSSTSTITCMYCVSGHGETINYLSPKARINDLIFQIGLAPKFYFRKEGDKGFYLTAALLTGLMDKYAVTTHISKISYPTGKPVPYDLNWVETSRSNVFEKNPYRFVKFELGVGYQTPEWKRFSLTIETGISSMSRRSGVKKDKVYLSLNGGAYGEALEQKTNNDVGFWGLDFGNREMDNYWLERNRFHFTNRLAIRCRLN